MDVAVTQTGSPTTAVAANGQVGIITTFAETASAGAVVTFPVNNSAVDADSVVLLGIQHYSGTTGIPLVRANNRIAGTSFDMVITNIHASGALNGILQIGFQLL